MARRGLNKVVFSGNLGKDPVVRQSKDGEEVVTTSLAVNTGQKDDAGKDVPSWANLVAFKKVGQLMKEYCQKGSHIAVTARWQQRGYTHPDTGEIKQSNEFIVEDLVFLDTKTQAEEQRGAQAQAPVAAASAKATKVAQTRNDPDDIPF